MASKNTAISFGSFEIAVSMQKAHQSRDLKTEYVNEAGAKVTMSGGTAGTRTPAPGVSKAVRCGDHVTRLPQDELAAIEQASKDAWSAMQVLEVIPYGKVETERIQGAYWLTPSQGSARGLFLLHAALYEVEQVAVVKWISTSREKLGVIRPMWVTHGDKFDRALMLLELSFANDFAAPDDDALAINEAEAMLQVDAQAYDHATAAARELVGAFMREPGGRKAIQEATDTAVDARLALVERLQSAGLGAELDATVADDSPVAA
jgi:non-homologous end joining protein Ku